MARPRRCRRVCAEPDYLTFFPDGIPGGEKVVLAVEEYEAIRLIDLEKFTHEHCAKQMDISRTTVTEIYESAREKIADCIVNGKTMVIEGGSYRLCDGSAIRFCQKRCRKPEMYSLGAGGEKQAYCPSVIKKGEDRMRIAATFENGEIFQHFGHTEQFKIYDVENGQIVNQQVIGTNGSGHGALAGLLTSLGVDTLICGGIGMGAKNALADAGIRLYGGVSGNADKAVEACIAGNLAYDPDIQCSHHEEGCHGEGHHGADHHCSEDKHGCSGNGSCR